MSENLLTLPHDVHKWYCVFYVDTDAFISRSDSPEKVAKHTIRNEWCAKHCQGKWWHSTALYDTSWQFTDKADAALFKLAFGDTSVSWSRKEMEDLLRQSLTGEIVNWAAATFARRRSSWVE